MTRRGQGRQGCQDDGGKSHGSTLLWGSVVCFPYSIQEYHNPFREPEKDSGEYSFLFLPSVLMEVETIIVWLLYLIRARQHIDFGTSISTLARPRGNSTSICSLCL